MYISILTYLYKIAILILAGLSSLSRHYTALAGRFETAAPHNFIEWSVYTMAFGSTADVLSVTKSAIAQGIAKGYMDVESGNLAALDDTAIIDLGQKLQIDENGEFTIGSPADLFFRSLVSCLSRVVIDTRAYVAKMPRLFVSLSEWGLISEFINIDLSDVMTDEMWNPDGFIGWNETRTLSDGVTTRTGQQEGARIAAIEFGCYKPAVNVRVYKKLHALMVALTTAREQLFTAFRSADEYSRFIAGLYVSVENTIQVKAEIYGKMCVSMGIAKSIAHGNAIDLRTEFAAVGGTVTGVTREKLLADNSFQAFALKRMSEIEDEMSRYTANYNNHEHVTFAAEPQKILLSKFASACKFGVRANTYNEKLLGIGDYDTVTEWQATKSADNTTPYNLASASSIYLSNAAATDAGLSPETGEPYLIEGIIGVVYDRFAMAVTIDRKNTTTQYAASRDTINTFHHAAAQYIVNDVYPIVSFYVSETE